MDSRIPGQVGYDPAVHHRRSIRLAGHDYAGGGEYFVTLCVCDRRPLFGTVVNGRMALNEAGRIAAECWRAIPEHFPQAVLDEWVIMPDHMHGILRIQPDAAPGRPSQAPAFARPIAGALGTILGAFKAATTRRIRMEMGLACTGLACQAPTRQAPTIWQRNYYEIIIRDARALHNIRRYIRENPANWDALRHGDPCFFAGNRDLLKLPLTAFFASRSGDSSGPATDIHPSRWPNPPAGVISGFLSPMERAVFDACLADGTPLVWILGRGLPAVHGPVIHRALSAGRLLILTPFDESVRGFSSARAAWCNQYALHLAEKVVVGSLSPGGILDCLLADLPRDLPVFRLESPP